MRPGATTAGRARVSATLCAVFLFTLASTSTSEAFPATANLAPSEVVLTDPRGRSVSFGKLVADHRLTVIVFYSSTCPCFAVHVPRLQALVNAFTSRGVAFVVVDSERHPDGEVAPSPATSGAGEPRLPAPYRDAGGQLARRLEAHFATQSFVFDSSGQLRYRGGLDDDRNELHAQAKEYLRQALDALLAGHAPAFATSKALGCALRLM